MSTSFIHRLMFIVPAAKVATIVAWLKANVDSQTDDNLGPALNASGDVLDPVTHRWISSSYTDAQGKALLAKVCQIASITPPTSGQWNSWSQDQKMTWFAGIQNTVLTNYGVYMRLSNNASSWDDPSDLLNTAGLKVIKLVSYS